MDEGTATLDAREVVRRIMYLESKVAKLERELASVRTRSTYREARF